jgi:uncharacterized damage-inducible protein DinB
MDPLITPISQTVTYLHDDIFDAVASLGDAAINWTHPPLTNTIGILLRHIAGSERQWIGAVAGGLALDRNRDAEFAKEQLQKAPLVDNLRRAHENVQTVLAALTASDLAAEIEVTWRGKARRVTKAWAILHSVQHTAYHLGQIRLFAKMASGR